MHAAPVAQILFFGAWINGLAFIAFTLLQSQGRPDITGKLHLMEALPFLAILWGLTNTTFGINGAAIAWSLRCTVDALALFWAAGMPRREVLSALRPAVLLSASGVAAHFTDGNWALRTLLVGSPGRGGVHCLRLCVLQGMGALSYRALYPRQRIRR